MKYDIILAGVGGQGVLSLAAIIATAAMKSGLQVRQSEVHGMAQRGGSVLAHLRISDRPIVSDLIARGRADMVLGMEPMETLRYADYLSADGVLVTASEPFVNIPDYPDVETILSAIRSAPKYRLREAKTTGSIKAANIVLVGAASEFIPVSEGAVFEAIESIFGRKGADVVELNRKAFVLGREGAPA